MNQFDRVTASFQPVRTDDLRLGAASAIGWCGEWEALWIIEDGAYEGQWAMSPRADDHATLPPFAWVPLCDLADVEPLPERP